MPGVGRPKITVRMDEDDLKLFMARCKEQGLDGAGVLRAYARYHARIGDEIKPPRWPALPEPPASPPPSQ